MDENLSRVFNFTEEGVFRKMAPSSSSRSRVDGLSSPRKNQIALCNFYFEKSHRVIFTRNVKAPSLSERYSTNSYFYAWPLWGSTSLNFG